jgi:hypothetical protein
MLARTSGVLLALCLAAALLTENGRPWLVGR